MWWESVGGSAVTACAGSFRACCSPRAPSSGPSPGHGRPQRATQCC